MILKLKELNRFIVYHHFKMDNIENCIHLMKPMCFMASIDLSDAYFSVPVDPSHKKYLKFLWNGRLYQFTCLAQGLSCAPRVFTKLRKPAYSHLRLKGHVSSGNLDGSFLEGDLYDACLSNVQDTITLLRGLGFCPNFDKSVVQPSHVLEHLGFILNSLDMSVSITDCNFRKFLDTADKILHCTIIPFRLVARLVGIMVSFSLGVEYAQTSKRKINHGKVTWELRTDVTSHGWGPFSEGVSTGDRWSPQEAQLHINALELLAVSFGLMALCSSEHHCHIKVLSDNTTTVAYLRDMGDLTSSL